MSIATDNRVAALEAWREKVEEAKARFEADMAAMLERLEEIGRQRQEVERGKPR